jgi:hypothetical protein
MQLQSDGTTITVPVPLHDPPRRGTLRSVIRYPGPPNRCLNLIRPSLLTLERHLERKLRTAEALARLGG